MRVLNFCCGWALHLASILFDYVTNYGVVAHLILEKGLSCNIKSSFPPPAPLPTWCASELKNRVMDISSRVSNAINTPSLL